MLDYDFPLFRPPSEGPNLIIQATLGCSFNRCSFCSMYRTKTFEARDRAEVFADIDRAARLAPDEHRVFLADGDALVLDTGELSAILDRLATRLPDLRRVSCYATPMNLLKKTAGELRVLREKRLSLVYLGIESGAPGILKRITKGANQDMIVEAIEKARAAGIKVSATMILGLGGRRRSEEHVMGCVELINRASPNYLSTLQLGLGEDIEEEFHRKFGEDFEPLRDGGMLQEARKPGGRLRAEEADDLPLESRVQRSAIGRDAAQGPRATPARDSRRPRRQTRPRPSGVARLLILRQDQPSWTWRRSCKLSTGASSAPTCF